jgi:hypothetical protein
VLLAGGNVDVYQLSSAELYDPCTGTWNLSGSLEQPRQDHTATLLGDGKVLVAAGVAGPPDDSISLSSAELYDPCIGTWSTTGSLNQGRFYHSGTLLDNGKVLVVGGVEGRNLDEATYLTSTELYDPSTGTWSPSGSLNQARHSHTATLLENGKVLVAGGYRDVALSSAELYDPSTGSWTPTGSMTDGRALHWASLLPSGKVLVPGGECGTGCFLAGAELYDPALETWSPTGSLNQARVRYSSTVLDTGTVLLAGGYDGDVLASSELFQEIDGADVSEGFLVTSELWIRAVIETEEKGPVEAVWRKGGDDCTSAGDWVLWGHFYADPDDVAWGSENNPELFVKIWFDQSGRVDVNFFHLSVPDIEVYSDYPYDGSPDRQDTTTLSTRYVRQYYENGQSDSQVNDEDGIAAQGYSAARNPWGNLTLNNLRIGAMINTVEAGPIEATWVPGGQDTTARGDQVVWGHFYANPAEVSWGSLNNPELFVKIWFDADDRLDVNFFHVSVPDIEVYSDFPNDGSYDQEGTCIMDDRYIRHEYQR